MRLWRAILGAAAAAGLAAAAAGPAAGGTAIAGGTGAPAASGMGAPAASGTGAPAAMTGMGAPAGTGGWRPVAAPQPPGDGGHALRSVACPTPSACLAVGANEVENTSDALAETWNGQTWTLRHPATVGARSELSGAACRSASDCTVVGWHSTDIAGRRATAEPLAEHWSGHGWRIEPLPATSRGGWLAAVACPSAKTCLAVGSTPLDRPLAYRWRSGGAGWSAVPLTAGIGTIDSLSCTSTTSCVAAGDRSGTPDPHAGPLLLSWKGKRWQSTTVPPSAAGDWLDSVACASASSCVAVGAHQTNSTASPASLVLTGRTWRSEPVPSSGPTTPDGQLLGVTCRTTASCTAVGSGTAGDGVAVAEHWNGSAWTDLPVAQPGSAATRELVGVSCPSWRVCQAVGDDTVTPVVGNGKRDLLVEQGPPA